VCASAKAFSAGLTFGFNITAAHCAVVFLCGAVYFLFSFFVSFECRSGKADSRSKGLLLYSQPGQQLAFLNGTHGVNLAVIVLIAILKCGLSKS
jgi:hypothetical protein